MNKDIKELLEKYKEQSPVKYAAKLEAGQFDKYLKSAKKPKEPKEEPKEEPKDKPKAKKK